MDKIQSIIGPRRVGKTSAMLLTMKELKRRNQESDILYFNFEDERIQFEPQELDLILQAWRELFPDRSLEQAWFFFDEVQAAPGWERFLNRINETLSKKIFFTGSNSSVLHTEIKSVMRGRSIAVELLPLAFGEYCDFIGFNPAFHGTGRSKTVAAFQKYLFRGGYPETVDLLSETIHTAYLQEYYNSMLLRDIVEYNQLSNYSYLRNLYRQAAASIGNTVSIRRMHNHLKAHQYSVGINSVYEAMDMAENAYLFKRVSRFDFSDSKREKSDKKIYWLDNGLLTATTTHYGGNKGLLLENAVFRELYRRYGNIYTQNIYYAMDTSSACDFVVYAEGGTPLPIQVCWSLADPLTRHRELRGLVKACEYCQVKEGWIITGDEDEELELEGLHVVVKASWKWMASE
ncbi:MAG TPA: ATP-binding protein [Chitinophagaceae bacterium]|nr:ATP-binding protein [Chitinophagaceae bacterium]